MMKGLPACGKTTEALELVAKGWKRVNKDDLRAMVDGGKWSHKNEHNIKELETSIVSNFLEAKYNVVVDDTNFAYEEYWKDVADTFDADFEVKFFDVPLGECIDRDSKRGEKSVGAKVICGMYEKYLYKSVEFDPKLPCCYLFDIDGTLAKMNGRSPYDYTKIDTDIENVPVTDLFRKLVFNDTVFIFSGREDSCKEETIKWLEEYVGDIYRELYMRKTGDKRKDSIVKKEMYETHIKGKYNVLGVFDDRLQVCRMWYELGLPLFRVGNPDSNF